MIIATLMYNPLCGFQLNNCNINKTSVSNANKNQTVVIFHDCDGALVSFDILFNGASDNGFFAVSQ